MTETLREIALPFALGVVVAAGISVYDHVSVPVVEYERRLPTFDEMIAAEVAMSDPNLLLPDLVPLPGRELTLQTNPDGHLHLLFSTTYYNQGAGDLELRADPATAGVRDDLPRIVYQHVFTRDGTDVERPVGVFEWHQTHRHYHFSDFVSYVLTPESAPNEPVILQKATFCIRDVSRLKTPVPGAEAHATYTVCGKERQGVSVGWGDTYFYTYPDQDIDLADIPSGTYRLTFIVNPAGRLREQAYLNNRSSVVFSIDKEKHSLVVEKEFPEDAPEIEHVHLDDPFGM